MEMCVGIWENMRNICGAGMGRLSQIGAVVNLYSPQNGLIYPLEGLLFIQGSYPYQGNLIQCSINVAIKGPYLIHIHIYIHYKTITTYVHMWTYVDICPHMVTWSITGSPFPLMSPCPPQDYLTHNRTIPSMTGPPHPSQDLPVHHRPICPSQDHKTIMEPSVHHRTILSITFHILCFQVTLFSKAKINVKQ